jgi:tetratricopeptide (TPR) repeat protein
MNRVHKAIHASLLAGAMLAMAGCSGSLPPPLPPARAEANHLNERGIEADRRGDGETAVAAFSQAYQRYAAIEHFPGMVTALINSARVSSGRGDFSSAQQALKRADALSRFTPQLKAEVCFEQARLLLRLGKAGEALGWGERALSSADGMEEARMLNLLADIRLRLAEHELAETLAERALTRALRHDDQREQATALRLRGECALKRGNTANAGTYFNQALVMDRELALGARIAADLRGLAATAELAGERQSALELWTRAADVSLAGSDRAGAIAGLERLALLYEQSGDTGSAARVRTRIAEIVATRGGGAAGQ